MKALGTFVLAIVCFVVSFWVDAWIIQKLWGWFVCPLGIAALGQGHALGLRLVVALFIDHPVNKITEVRNQWRMENKEEISYATAIATVCVAELLRALFFWVAGSYFHTHMTYI